MSKTTTVAHPAHKKRGRKRQEFRGVELTRIQYGIMHILSDGNVHVLSDFDHLLESSTRRYVTQSHSGAVDRHIKLLIRFGFNILQQFGRRVYWVDPERLTPPPLGAYLTENLDSLATYIYIQNNPTYTQIVKDCFSIGYSSPIGSVSERVRELKNKLKDSPYDLKVTKLAPKKGIPGGTRVSIKLKEDWQNVVTKS